MEKFSKIISDIFLWIMNIGLLIIGVLLSFGLIMEAKEIYHEGVKFLADQGNYQHFVEGILVFFLYFILSLWLLLWNILKTIIIFHLDILFILESQRLLD